MRVLKSLAAIAALTLGAGMAQAQVTGNTGPGTPNLVGSAESRELRGIDETESNLNKARDEARNAARPKGNRALPAKPEDVTVGSDIRDSKGVLLGKVESVGMAAAVVASAGGKVEVPLEAFGKNSKGLLLPVTKAEFDKMVADANTPAG